MRDAGHDRYAVLAEHYLREDIPQSQYLWVSGAGPVKTLALQMKSATVHTVRIRRIVLNARQPLFIVWWRFLGVFLAGCIIYGLRKQSVLWRERGDLAKGIESGLFAALGGVLFIPGFSMVLKNESIKLHLAPYIYLLVMAASLLIYLGVYLFLRLLADRMERIPYAYLLLLTAGVTMGCQLPYFINQPDVGALQHVFIEMFFIWGIYLMFRFAYSKQEKDQKRYRGWLLLGVVCLVLALIWWGVFQTAHEAEWSIYRLWEGVYGYWLKLPECTYVFPFMETVSEQRSGYRGMLFGGLLVSSPMVIILLALLRYRTEKKEYRAILLSSFILMGGAIFVFLMDVFTKRIDYPNIVDFALPVLLASAIAWMYFGKVFRDTYAESILRKGLCLLLGISVLYHANFIWYSGGDYPLAGGNTEMYYQLFYTFMFW
ncbi:MAG: hypothetical protein K6B69_15005 [Lachnospiraceae bacterium]|nr:hypothetical protein [Lachnospiraceae bacterium]